MNVILRTVDPVYGNFTQLASRRYGVTAPDCNNEYPAFMNATVTTTLPPYTLVELITGV